MLPAARPRRGAARGCQDDNPTGSARRWLPDPSFALTHPPRLCPHGCPLDPGPDRCLPARPPRHRHRQPARLPAHGHGWGRECGRPVAAVTGRAPDGGHHPDGPTTPAPRAGRSSTRAARGSERQHSHDPAGAGHRRAPAPPAPRTDRGREAGHDAAGRGAPNTSTCPQRERRVALPSGRRGLSERKMRPTTPAPTKKGSRCPATRATAVFSLPCLLAV
jgi:hypothetical protein